MSKKKCCACKKLLSITNFNKNKNGKDGLSFQCRKCSSLANKKYHEKNKDEINKKKREYRKGEYGSLQVFKYGLKRYYGISWSDYCKLKEFQKDCCDICEVHEEKLNHRLCVDHDHKTGKIRSLLCRRCNAVLGLVKENKDILTNMLSYLNY